MLPKRQTVPERYRYRPLGIPRAALAQYLHRQLQIPAVVKGGAGVVLPHRDMHIFPLGHNQVIPRDQPLQIRKAQLVQRPA